MLRDLFTSFYLMFKKNLKKIIPPFTLNFLKKIKYQLDFLPFSKTVFNNQQYRNKHKGERCFILGSGPSVSLEDLKPLRDEALIALNSFYVHHDYKKIFNDQKSKYHLIAPLSDPVSEDNWKEWFMEIQSNIPNSVKIFFGLNNRKPSSKEIIDKHELFKDKNINWFFSTKNKDDEELTSSDIDSCKNILSSGNLVMILPVHLLDFQFEHLQVLPLHHHAQVLVV